MSQEPPQISILDARLAEIDRRLSTIQTGLVPDARAAQSPPPASLPPRVEVPEPATASETDLGPLGTELRRIAAAHERLLESTRELVAAYEHALARLGRPPAAPAVQEFSVSAGPFTSTEALRGFEQTLSQIPEVREVAVRGYEGDDRAIVDVHLFEPTS